jgi:hypothetical protein
MLHVTEFGVARFLGVASVLTPHNKSQATVYCLVLKIEVVNPSVV